MTIRKRRRWLFLVVLLAVALALFAYTRGTFVGPAPSGAVLDAAIAAMTSSGPKIQSLADIQMVGLVAAGLTREEGKEPGPFRVHYLERLDTLEKFHHLMHGPFSGIVRIYCDIWVNSVTTYGTEEPTWGFQKVIVRPSIKLPVMLFLMERFARSKSQLEESLGAPYEAVSGMTFHTVPGRAQVWKRVVAAARRHPVLITFLHQQIRNTDLHWTDSAEGNFWAAVMNAPDPGVLDRLAAATSVPPPKAWPDLPLIQQLLDRLLAEQQPDR